MKRTFQATKLLLVLGLLFTASGTLSAAIVGTFSIGGNTADVSTTSVVTFTCAAGLTIAPCPAGTGNAFITSATGDMVPNFATGVFLGDLTELFNTNILVPNWLTLTPTIFNGIAPNVALDLTFIPTGTGGQADCSLAPAPGQTCTPTGAPISAGNPLGLWDLTLVNTSTGFTAALDVRGITRDLLDGSTGVFKGTFTSTITGESFQTALANLEMGIHITPTYAASFTLSAVPEPSYMAGFAGLALVVSAIALYRKRRLQRQ
jgi:hypothetical protein